MSWLARDWALEQWHLTRRWPSRHPRAEGIPTGFRITPTDKCVLLALGDRASDPDDLGNHSCTPSVRLIAEDVGVTKRVIGSSLDRLVAAKLIYRDPRYENGRRTSSTYTLRISEDFISEWKKKHGKRGEWEGRSHLEAGSTKEALKEQRSYEPFNPAASSTSPISHSSAQGFHGSGEQRSHLTEEQELAQLLDSEAA